jgi:hypothetical protein
MRRVPREGVYLAKIEAIELLYAGRCNGNA